MSVGRPARSAAKTTALLALLVSALALHEPSSPALAAPATEVVDDASAEVACARPWHTPTDVLRWAVLRVAERKICRAEPGLTLVVEAVDRDVLTRSVAALALGELACHRDLRGRRVDGLSAIAAAALESASSDENPAGLRQAAVRARGRARVSEAPEAVTLLRNEDDDPVVRFLAAQAVTRITGTDQFDASLRDELVAAYLDRGSHYDIIDRPVSP